MVRGEAFGSEDGPADSDPTGWTFEGRHPALHASCGAYAFLSHQVTHHSRCDDVRRESPVRCPLRPMPIAIDLLLNTVDALWRATLATSTPRTPIREPAIYDGLANRERTGLGREQ